MRLFSTFFAPAAPLDRRIDVADDALHPRAQVFFFDWRQHGDQLGSDADHPQLPVIHRRCESAWNKAPVLGVIGIQSRNPGKRAHIGLLTSGAYVIAEGKRSSDEFANVIRRFEQEKAQVEWLV
jgi:hypothetical protein